MPESQGAPSALRARVLTGSGLMEDAFLSWDGDRITGVGTPGTGGPAATAPPDRWAWPPDGWGLTSDCIVLPGLVDLHCHGGDGSDFTSGDSDAARTAARYHHGQGTTTLLASTVTAPLNELVRAFTVLAGIADEGLLAGIHAEGPFIAPQRCGAQDTAHIRSYTVDAAAQLISAANGRLSTMTYAPELPGASELASLLASHGTVASLGHTDCTGPEAAAALDESARHRHGADTGRRSGRPTVTHLFNAMRGFHHRSPGPVPVLLERARAGSVALELIADGRHLHPDTVRAVFALVGAGNVCLVSDATAATGRAGGIYTLGSTSITVEDGAARIVSSDHLAGGSAPLLHGVRTAVRAGVSLQEAVLAATEVPAGIIGLNHEVGRLSVGRRADAVVLSPELELLAVLRGGVWIRHP